MAEVAPFWARGRLLGDLAPLRGMRSGSLRSSQPLSQNQGPEAEAAETSARGDRQFPASATMGPTAKGDRANIQNKAF